MHDAHIRNFYESQPCQVDVSAHEKVRSKECRALRRNVNHLCVHRHNKRARFCSALSALGQQPSRLAAAAVCTSINLKMCK